MAKLGINTGSSADDGTGDSLRVGAGKINSNFNEVYSLLTGAGNNGTTLLSGIVTSITAGSNITLSGGPTGAIEITAAALTGTGFFTNNSTGIHTLGSVGIGTTTAENNGLSVPLGNVFVGKGVTTLNLNVAGVTTFSGGDINVSGDNYDMMWDASVDTLEFGDNAKIAFGAGSDLTLYHDTNNSWIKDQAAGNLLIDSNGAAVKITKAGAAETMAEFNTDGPVKLFHNNVRVLETVSTGATVVGDLYVGGDLFVLDDVTYNEMNSVNLNVTGVSTFGGTSNLNGDLRVGVSTLFADVSTGRVGVGTDVPGDLFFVDGSLTASGLSTFSGGISLKDNSKINLGTGNDAEIYFDSSNLYIKETTGSGDIYVESDDVYIRANGGGSTMAAFKSGAESILYHNGNAKATTDVGGIIITGVATATGFSGPLTGTATGLSGSPSIEVTNIVGAAASIAGIVTATSFSGSGANLTNLPSALQEIDLWTITADSNVVEWDDSDNDVLGPTTFGVTIARCTTTQNALFAKQGTGMSYSSGVFSFPSTGTYEVSANLSFRNDEQSYKAMQLFMQLTTNNSSYSKIARAYAWTNWNDPHPVRLGPVQLTITNTSLQKIRFTAFSDSNNMSFNGATDMIESSFSFKKLA